MTQMRPRDAGSNATDQRRATKAADAVWRLLCHGASEPWLDEIRTLRADHDAFEATLDIWTVALTAELKDPVRQPVASKVLARLRRLSEELDDAG